MTNTILAFDEQDNLLGTFFSSCKAELDGFFSSMNIKVDELNSHILNDVAVTLTTGKYSHFVFGAYSHGDNHNLLKSALTPYVSVALNGVSFRNSFFYTFSCESGKNLGKDLIDNDCLCFIGYKNAIAIWSTYQQPFVECATFGLKQFFNGHDTFSIINQMIEKYNEKIDETYTVNPITASILRENRDALILHGKQISVSDLIVESTT